MVLRQDKESGISATIWKPSEAIRRLMVKSVEGPKPAKEKRNCSREDVRQKRKEKLVKEKT
jgi:hypothetical protein